MNDAIFVALLFRGGREGAEAPQIFHPGAGVRFVVIQHLFLIVRMLLQFPEIEFPGPRRF